MLECQLMVCQIDPSFQPVLHDWCNKGCGMCYPACGMVHIKELLLLIIEDSPCSGGSGLPLSLSVTSFNIVLLYFYPSGIHVSLHSVCQ